MKEEYVLQYELIDTGQYALPVVMRVYDREGRITLLARKVGVLKAQQEKYIRLLGRSVITDWYARWKIDCISSRIKRLKYLILQYCIDYLCDARNKNQHVARGTHDHEFRIVQPEELEALTTAAANTEKFRLFVFAPGNLLDLDGEIINSIG